MKPSSIFEILNLARRARSNGHNFNPLFVGPPGLGKSEIVQQWCKVNNLPFIDIRAAYLEAPDMIGFPSIEVKNGRQVTVHNTPDFWPGDPEWEGVVLLEEPNRGTTSVMNTFMQMLTDRKLHSYTFPRKTLFVGCINPESETDDVNMMGSALRDRFEIFEVTYDKSTFLDFMRKSEWDRRVVDFVDTNTWKYVRPDDIGNAPGTKYISPRTLSKLNAALKATVPNEMELTVYEGILGKNIAQTFLEFIHNTQPVTYDDLVKSTKKALKKLAEFSNPKDYKAAHVSITVRDILEKNDIKDDLLAEVLTTIPADQSANLMSGLEFARKKSDPDFYNRMLKNFPEVKNYFKKQLKAE